MRHPFKNCGSNFLKVTLVLLNAFGTVLSWSEASCGPRSYRCVSPTKVQQCVDGVPMGHVEECGSGFLCDSSATWGPCVAQPEDQCCEEGLFPVQGTCQLFMSCVNDGTTLIRFFGVCAPGFSFHPHLSACHPIANSSMPCDFGERNISSNSSLTTTDMTSSSSTMIYPTTTTTTTTIETTTTSKPTTKSKPVCTSPGHYPDPLSCRHYYVCSWAAGGGVNATRVKCVQNLLFDSNLRQCVFTSNCGTRPR